MTEALIVPLPVRTTLPAGGLAYLGAGWLVLALAVAVWFALGWGPP